MDFDKKGFVHGYLKLSGIWPTGERCYLEGDFTAHAGGPEDIEQKIRIVSVCRKLYPHLFRMKQLKNGFHL